ncbi:hypothetical protein C8R45DRAFT_1001562 [Mycena sanguinolenta]|nr:hypothetical protein C8R45DRAFT_1001562 [Mycena sanguinolenta]
MFTAASGFKFNGGNFYDISGDMNIHGRQPAILQGNPPIALESGLNNASSREVVLGERHGREDEASRVAPSAGLDERVPLSNIIIGGNVNRIQHGERGGLHILHCATAGDAFHNSAERYPQPKCHPETRTGMLDDLWDWSSNTHRDTVAQTFCQKLEAENCLGAIVEEDPAIVDRTLSIQLQKLIIGPCRQTVCSEFPTWLSARIGWNHYLPRCPPLPKLLQDVESLLTSDFYLSVSDCGNGVQWLKIFPDPPQELIRHSIALANKYLSRFGAEVIDSKRDWWSMQRPGRHRIWSRRARTWRLYGRNREMMITKRRQARTI